jgi:VanZ family protein
MVKSQMLRRLSRIAASACIIAIVVLSWLPKEMEHRTGLPGQVEHLVAYAGTGILAKFGFKRSKIILIGLTLLAALLEIGQAWIPGRTSQLVDFLASSMGAVLGVAIELHLARRFEPRGLHKASVGQ